MKAVLLAIVVSMSFGVRFDRQAEAAPWPARMQVVLEETRPLKFSRENRLPLYLWPAMGPGELDEAAAERLVKLLD